jgi:N-acetylglucosamine-6-phosphate deacetylase
VLNGRTELARQPGQHTIAGSVITMRQGLGNAVRLGIPIEKAVRMSSFVPAKVAGIDSDQGSINKGLRADLIALDDNLCLRFACIAGSPSSRGA